MTAGAAPRLHWIAGYPGSGTTLIRAMIHKLLYGPDSGAPTGPLALQSPDMTTLSALYAAEFDDGLKPGEWVEMAERARAAQAKAAERGTDLFVWTRAANIAFNRVSFIDWRLTASFVYVYRDPREVLGAYAHRFGLTLDQALASLNNDENFIGQKNGLAEPLLSWSAHVSSWLQMKDGNLLAFKFETIVDRRRDTAKTLNDFFKFGRTDEELDAIADQCGFDHLKAQEDAFGFAEGQEGRPFFRQGRSASWPGLDGKKYLNPIKTKHGDVMKTLGYRR